MTNVKAIIFDMDGVIFDSEQVYFEACLMAAKRNQVEITKEFARGFSGRTSLSCQLILKDFLKSSEKVEQFWYDWGVSRQEILLEKGLPFKDGFLSLFSYIQEMPVETALVTSANQSDLLENFSRNDSKMIKYFSPIITIEDVTHAKPHPEPYELAMKKLQLSPSECIVIEDSVSGVSAALSAGAKTIMLSEESIDQHISDKLYYKAAKHDDILEFIQQNS